MISARTNPLFLILLCVGLFRDAERQFRSSLTAQPIVSTYLELCNVYLRLDLPNTAMDVLMEARCVILFLQTNDVDVM